MESSSTVINMPIVARFADAAVSKFVEILALQKFRVSLTIRERSHDRRLPSTVKE
jgi:hypothetical protein